MCAFHDPGSPKFEKRVARSQQGVTRNTELYMVFSFSWNEPELEHQSVGKKIGLKINFGGTRTAATPVSGKKMLELIPIEKVPIFLCKSFLVQVSNKVNK